MFLIQSSSLPYEAQVKTLDVIKDLGVHYEDFGILPFVDEYVNIKSNYPEPVVVLGSCKAVALAKNYPQLYPGVFFNEDSFSVEHWSKELGDEMLNTPHTRSVAELAEGFTGDLFVRPTHDLKLFSGMVVNHSEFMEWWSNNKDKGGADYYNIKNSTLLAVSIPTIILGEWRCFVVDSKVVSGSQYKKNGYLNVTADFPSEVYEYATKICNIWIPNEVCVVDIALTHNGYKVIEFNCFNASGWYKVDQHKVISSVHGYVMSHY